MAQPYEAVLQEGADKLAWEHPTRSSQHTLLIEPQNCTITEAHAQYAKVCGTAKPPAHDA